MTKDALFLDTEPREFTEDEVRRCVLIGPNIMTEDELGLLLRAIKEAKMSPTHFHRMYTRRQFGYWKNSHSTHGWITINETVIAGEVVKVNSVWCANKRVPFSFRNGILTLFPKMTNPYEC